MSIPRFNDQDLFRDLEEEVSELIQKPNRSTADGIRKALNNIFEKNTATCKEVIYTNNTDKLFFGLCVMPYLDDDKVEAITNRSNKVKINSYYLEIDSKLIEMVGLNAGEITACILHEIGHVVVDSSTVDTVKKALDLYLADNDDNIDIKKALTYKDLLRAGISDAIRKVDSIFSNQDVEYIADEFVVASGYGHELESACKKIVNRTGKINKNVQGKFIVLQWTLNIYKNMSFRRIPAISTLNKAKKFEGSQLVKRNIVSMINNLETSTYKEDYIQEGFKSFIASLGDKYRYNAINTLEDELYEYNLKVKNVDISDEAMVLLREINSRMSLLYDYIQATNRSENEKEVKRCEGLLGKYRKLRDDLMKKNTYDEKYLSLFTSTPIIKSRYEL